MGLDVSSTPDPERTPSKTRVNTPTTILSRGAPNNLTSEVKEERLTVVRRELKNFVPREESCRRLYRRRKRVYSSTFSRPLVPPSVSEYIELEPCL